MSEEEKKEASKTVPVLPCGHDDSFEHRFVDGLLQIADLALMTGASPIEPCIEYTRKIFDAFYLQIPTYEEMRQISLARAMEDPNKKQEVN